MSPDRLEQPGLRELLYIADTEWVLGHWYIKTMRNGRSLPDFNALAGMAQDALGHTRAWFGLLEDRFDLEPDALQFDRGPGDVYSMDVLDAPPRNWSDFVVAAYLAEQALAALQALLFDRDASLANLAAQCSAESRFHRLYLLGWIKNAAGAELDELHASARSRVPVAMRWLGSPVSESLAEALATEVGWQGDGPSVRGLVAERVTHAGRRGGPLPSRLWEFMVPTNAQALMCRRPLRIQADDSIRFAGAT